MVQKELPRRTSTNLTDDEAVPDGDPADTVGLLSERLRAWKHMCGYLEGYIEAVSKEQKSNGKDQEKVLKVSITAAESQSIANTNSILVSVAAASRGPSLRSSYWWHCESL